MRLGVSPRIPTLQSRLYGQPDHLTAPVFRRSCCPFGSTSAVKGPAVSTRGRLLHAPTDWRILCSPIPSVPAVRQLPAGKSGLAKRSSPGLPRGRRVEKLQGHGCVRLACELGNMLHRGGDVSAWGQRVGGGSEKPWKQRLRVKSALGEEALNRHCAKKCCGRDVRVWVEVRRAPWRRRIASWRRRARETARRRRKCAVSALGVEEKVIARENAQGQVRLVWRRRRSGRVGVRAENACAGGAHLCGGESVQGTLGCAQTTRGGRRVRNALEWQGGAQMPNGLVVCPTVLGVGWSVKARWTSTMRTFTVLHVDWSTIQRERDCCKTPCTFNRHATFRV